MNYKKKTRSITIYMILVLCLLLTGLYRSPSEVQAKVSEKKLYMDYLEKEEKRLRKVEYAESEIVGYHLIDLNNDGQKELVYDFWCGGARSEETVCMIKNGKVEVVYDAEGHQVIGQTFYKIKGSKNKFVAGGACSATEYMYDVYKFSNSNVKKIATYRRIYEDIGRGCYKDGKRISKQSYLKFEKKLKRVELKYN